MDGVIRNSVIACPHCGFAQREEMPVDACQLFYDCPQRGVRLRPQRRRLLRVLLVRLGPLPDSRLPIGVPEKQTYLIFVSSNCRKSRKMYSLYASHNAEENSTAGNCYKFGEVPPFGTQPPNRLLRLFGKDAKVFLKGRQCENHALGVGAFSYYRRVVESHKDQIFDEIIKVTKKIAPDRVASLETAKREQQFLKAIERVKRRDSARSAN